MFEKRTKLIILGASFTLIVCKACELRAGNFRMGYH